MTTVKADPILGGKDGAALVETVALADKVLDKFGTPELRNMLSKTGYGNHPELVRIFRRIGETLKDDSVILNGRDTGGNPNKGKTPEERAARMFPSTQKKKEAA